MDGGHGGALFDARPSVLGQVWRLRPADQAAARDIAVRHGVSDLVARALVARGVGVDAVPQHLQPRLRDSLPDPFRLADMERAVAHTAAAIGQGQPVAVFADYDVDGATSAALVIRYLRAVGAAEPMLYVPDRATEGYGPNVPAVESLHARGAGLLILVDCGTTAVEPLGVARTAGLPVVVLDHHACAGALPPAAALVNPNRPDDGSGLGMLAACGVVFLFLVALNRALRAVGRFDNRPEPDLLGLLDLVALGSVCDVVPLTGLNRVLVHRGLTVARQGGNPGLTALAQAAGLTRPPDAAALGFAIGPRINAAGRVGRSDLGARLLATDDPVEADRLARALCTHNEDRKTIEAAVLAAAVAAAQAEDSVILVAGDGWHPGVIGIVAGRLRERFHRPACVVALDGDGGTGSGRSVPGFDLGAAILRASADGLLERGGGHAMAAGFAVRRDRLGDLRAFLNHAAKAADAYVPCLEADALLSVGGATPAAVDGLAALGPFGPGNPEPRVILPDLRVARARMVGNGHLSCRLQARDGRWLDAIAFRAADTPLAELLARGGDLPVTLAGTLLRDTWGGRDTVRLRIEDAMMP